MTTDASVNSSISRLVFPLDPITLPLTLRISDSERPKIDLKLIKSNISSSFLINLNDCSGEKPRPIADTISLALKRQEGSVAFSDNIILIPPALLST